MALRLVQANLKARDDAALGRFWAETLGWVATSTASGATSAAPAGFVWTDPHAPVCIDVIALSDPDLVKHRAHLELRTTSTAHRTELIARLIGLGATPVDTDPSTVGPAVFSDAEGNQFCVLQPSEADRDTGPIAAVAVDCADPQNLARFYTAAMDWVLQEATEDQAVLRSPSGVGPRLRFLRTPHLEGGQHRVHLDLVPGPGDGQAAEVARLQTLGATTADVGQGDVSWVVLADPEGNEFCVLAPG